MTDELDDSESPEPPDPPGEIDAEEERRTGDGPFAYSATRLETSQCLFRFWARYVEKLPEARSPVLGAGAFAHRVIDRYITKCVAARVAGEGLFADQALNEVWAEAPTLPVVLYDDAFELIHRFAQSFTLKPEQVVGTELEWAVDRQWQPCGWMDPQVRRRGRVDLLEVREGEAIVVDWKSHRAALSQRDMEKAWGTKIYPALAVAHNPSLKRLFVVFHFVRSGIRRVKEFSLLDVMRAREDVERAEARLDTLLARGPGAEWPAEPGPSCTICGFVSICPRKAEVEALNVVLTPEAAKTAAENVLYLETALARQREMLRAWVRVAGAVQVGPVRFDFWKESKWECEVKALLAACRRFGIPVEAVVRPDVKAIRRIERMTKGFAEAVEAILRDVGATKFKWRKAEDK